MGADASRLSQGLAVLAQSGILYLVFTGGEPLLYPNLVDVLGRAGDLKFETLLCTNGSLLDSNLLAELQAGGLGSLIISIDAASTAGHDKHRGLPGLIQHIKSLLPEMKHRGFKVIASVTLSRLVNDLQALLTFLEELGFELVTFSYPLTRLNSTYLGYADHESVRFTPGELYNLLGQIESIKSKTPLHILNPGLSLRELRRQLTHRRQRFPCLAGYKYFFLDWQMNVYRCHFWDKPLGKLEDFPALSQRPDGCRECLIDCYRDASVYQYVAVSLAEALTALRQGQIARGLGQLLHPQNFLSAAALLEGCHWVRSC